MVKFFNCNDEVIDVGVVGVFFLLVVIVDVVDFFVEVDGVVFCYVGCWGFFDVVFEYIYFIGVIIFGGVFVEFVKVDGMFEGVVFD